MQIVHHADMDAKKILRLYSEGHRLVCRYCKVEFKTTPETLALGEIPLYVVCPSNPNHMTLLTEPAAPMKVMRELMEERKKAGLTKGRSCL